MAAVDINRGTAGVALPAAVSSEIWGNLIEASAVMQAARQIALPGSGVSIPMITGEATASWTAESEEKAVSRSTISNKTMTAYTLSVIEPFSNQFKRDIPALYAELVRRLPAALSSKFDSTVYGVGAAPGANFDQLTTSPAMTVDATGTFGDLAAVVNAVAAAGGDVSAWLASPSLYGLLLTAADANGRQFFVTDPSASRNVGSVFGSPVFKTRAGFMTSTTVGDTTGIAGDWANSAVYGTVEGVQISVSDQATLNDGGTAINLWQRNMFAVRAEIEVGFRVRDVNHFVRVTDGAVDTP
jgi:HK97 family phage major capsid protein